MSKDVELINRLNMRTQEVNNLNTKRRICDLQIANQDTEKVEYEYVKAFNKARYQHLYYELSRLKAYMDANFMNEDKHEEIFKEIKSELKKMVW